MVTITKGLPKLDQANSDKINQDFYLEVETEHIFIYSSHDQ